MLCPYPLLYDDDGLLAERLRVVIFHVCSSFRSVCMMLPLPVRRFLRLPASTKSRGWVLSVSSRDWAAAVHAQVAVSALKKEFFLFLFQEEEKSVKTCSHGA